MGCGGLVTVTAVTVPLDDLKAVLDIATESMDFGSGFLDHDEVATLRRIAEAVGVDPMEATPSEWRRQYAHDFRATVPGPYWSPNAVASLAAHPRCAWCRTGEQDAIHHGADALSRLAADPSAD
jgi:hypothetical protein